MVFPRSIKMASISGLIDSTFSLRHISDFIWLFRNIMNQYDTHRLLNSVEEIYPSKSLHLWMM